ncbi:MAG: pyrroline-5-carboxylate reductase [Candidatus Omnitrophica bacterium]|nr:pyrroline-5-carboxylate reductase [Candidatus Omnitrophota bacterium]
MKSHIAPKNIKVAIIGCGNMGASIIRGLVEASFYPQNLHITDADTKKTNELKKDLGVKIAKTNRQAASIADAVILAVKPQVLDSVVDDLATILPPTTLVISIAAGVPVSRIRKSLKDKNPVIRVMPNLPALIGQGISAYALGPGCTPKHRQITELILKSIGSAVEVKESLMDVVTAVSGSGPAYCFLLAEKMIESAYELGLKSQTAKQLVYQTFLGSAKMMAAGEADPDELIARVASKGGTTEAALKVFRSRGFGKVVKEAMTAAQRRAVELSKGK